MSKKLAHKIEWLPILKVRPNADNPRTIKDVSFQRLVRSLKECPELFEARPLLCSNRTKKLVVIGGNMRLKAALELGYETVPVITMCGLTKSQEKEISIKDNGTFGEWILIY